MKENVKQFLELLETDIMLKQKAEELGEKGTEGIGDLIALAAAYQISLTEEDFWLSEHGEVSDDELNVLTGGRTMMECVCALAGNSGQCSCVAGGQGGVAYSCTCLVGGYGGRN